MSILEKYKNPKDVPQELLGVYCRAIRRFLLQNISRSGGHLASNLGVVELTVALHRVYSTERDRLVFDVGHQSYVHKLLTERGEDFKTFRTLGGLSGFTKPSESKHDAFISGHASTAVSAALGMARARTLMGRKYRVAAVLGDGALTGGLAYEGLCDAGQSGEPLVVVLNDNDMSISHNVGAIADQLTRLRLKPRYFTAKKVYHAMIDGMPGGKRIDAGLRSLKDRLRDAVVPGTFFEQFGFVYLGPVDGHNVTELEFLLRQAISMKKPVLIHALTIKGKGYSPAEEHPSDFHGVGRFDLETGHIESKSASFSSVFGEALCQLAQENPRICAVTAAMPDGTGLTPFAERFPERFFDVGIAEGHAVTMAAGLAKQGLRPVVAVYSTFLQRAYDQMLHDVGILGLPVVLAVDRADLVGEDGETHHGLFDPRFLSDVPDLTLLAPSSFAELRAMLRKAFTLKGPVAIRYPRGSEGAYTDCRLGVACLKEGSEVTLVTYGVMVNEALAAAGQLEKSGASVKVIKIDTLKPFESEETKKMLQGRVFLLEENSGILSRYLPGIPLNTGDRFVPHGSRTELLKYCGLDAESIAETVERVLAQT